MVRYEALTLPAYLPDLSGVFRIEEPENGIHPRAVETVFQSLSSVDGARVLLATHSPVILSIVEPRQVLCFSKTDDGATDLVNGSEHPALKAWRGETNLSVLFAGGSWDENYVGIAGLDRHCGRQGHGIRSERSQRQPPWNAAHAIHFARTQHLLGRVVGRGARITCGDGADAIFNSRTWIRVPYSGAA